MARFESFGETADLDQAINAGSQAARATPAGHGDRPDVLTNLGLACLTRYQRYGNTEDLGEAVRYCTEAAECAGAGHPRGQIFLSNAGLTYRTRFELTTAEADLAESIRYAEAAWRGTPADDTESARNAANLAGAYQLRFTWSGDRADLDRAIELWQQTERLWAGEADYAAVLSGLGLAFRMRFEQAGADADLDEAIRYSERAVVESSGTHAAYGGLLLNCAVAYKIRFDRFQDDADLGQAFRYAQRAVQVTPEDHPERAKYLCALATVHELLFRQTGRTEHLDHAISCWRSAVSCAVAPAHQRVRAAVAWGIACESLEDPAPAAEGFAAAVRLLPVLAWRGLERSVREKHLADAGGLVTDAAAWAIEAGDLQSAVELLELGRSVLWSQSLQLRTDLTRLRLVDEGLAARLDGVRAALDRPRTAFGAPGEETVKAGRNQELLTNRHRELARQWDELIGQVRGLQGLETFLAATPFGRLREAASGGPVVLVNISNRRCDALIVTAAGVRLRALPRLNADECTRRANTLLDTLYPSAPGTALRLERERISTLFAVMSWLWDTICEPVLADLTDQGDLPAGQPAPGGVMPRVWWCPTGPLTVLPLHAAGHHTAADGRCLSRLAVSSYTPTLEALLRSRERAQTGAPARMLAVGMPTTPGTGDLQFHDLAAVPAELARLTEVLPDGSVTVLRSPTRDELDRGTLGQEETQPTGDRVMRALASHSWVHFACHGGQDLMAPSHGAIYLTDGPLTVLRLAAAELPAAELAFLSACQTAVGGVRLPDETIHLAAAVQFAGYRHVIATAWPIADKHAPEVTGDTYAELAATGRLDTSRAAAAIHGAVEALKARRPDRPDLWAPYLHIGP